MAGNINIKNGKDFEMHGNVITGEINIGPNCNSKIWCKVCRKELKVNNSECLELDWPECCGQTMTIDHPDKK